MESAGGQAGKFSCLGCSQALFRLREQIQQAQPAAEQDAGRGNVVQPRQLIGRRSGG